MATSLNRNLWLFCGDWVSWESFVTTTLESFYLDEGSCLPCTHTLMSLFSITGEQCQVSREEQTENPGMLDRHSTATASDNVRSNGRKRIILKVEKVKRRAKHPKSCEKFPCIKEKNSDSDKARDYTQTKAEIVIFWSRGSSRRTGAGLQCRHWRVPIALCRSRKHHEFLVKVQ